jgi:SAM-dependent methyltransferase
MDTVVGEETEQTDERTMSQNFLDRYLSGNAVLDLRYRGGDPDDRPTSRNTIGIGFEYSGSHGMMLPFENASQDAVFASRCLEYLENDRAILADWYRVLKIGGYMVIAVPNQYLYERKWYPPSRFNGGHKRFYTPRSLLIEIEQALPLGGYRVRSLRDIDTGFDYTVPPEDPPRGCYEIELVLEKIPVAAYIGRLRPSPVAAEVYRFFVSMLIDAIVTSRAGEDSKLQEIQAIMKQLPPPPFKLLAGSLEASSKRGDGPQDVTRDELLMILRPVINDIPFDEACYLRRYPDIARAVSEGRAISGHWHFVVHGYFEGRSAAPEPGIFDH